jgi:hypothetical protein
MSSRVLAEIVSDVVQGSGSLVKLPVVAHSDRDAADSTVAARTGLCSTDVIRMAGLEVVWGDMTQEDIDRTTDEMYATREAEKHDVLQADKPGEIEVGWRVLGKEKITPDIEDKISIHCEECVASRERAEPAEPEVRVYSIRLETDVDEETRGLDPVTVFERESLRRVGTRAMLADMNSVGGFHLEEIGPRAQGDSEEIDPEIEADGQDMKLRGIIPMVLIEKAELRQAAMEVALTQADQA